MCAIPVRRGGLLSALLVVVLLAAGLPAGATTAQVTTGVVVQGRVVRADGTPVAGALVSIRELVSQTTFSDPTDAAFTFFDVAPGSYRLDIKPDDVNNAPPLLGYTFEVTGSDPLDLGAITLPRSVKTVSGSVQRDGAPLAGVTITAINIEPGAAAQFASTRSSAGGAFTLGLLEGAWEIRPASPPPGANWRYTRPPGLVVFPSDGISETVRVLLPVQPLDVTVTGRLLGPDGTALPPISGVLNRDLTVVAWDNASYNYSTAFPDATGAFTLSLTAGWHTVSVDVNRIAYPDLSSPPALPLAFEPGVSVLSPILRLVRRDAGIAMTVRDNSTPPQPVAGALVQAYQPGGAIGYAESDAAGHAELRVTPGDWLMTVFPPISGGYLALADTPTLSTTTGVTATLAVTLEAVAAQISGVLTDQRGAPLTDVVAWAYARRAGSPAYLSTAAVNNGTFSLPAPAGDIRVGLVLAAGSPYALTAEVTPTLALASQGLEPAAAAMRAMAPYEQAFSVPAAGASLAATSAVTITLARNSARITGVLRDRAGQPLRNVSGIVTATPTDGGGAWQRANLGSDGSYRLAVAPGRWNLSYALDGDLYRATPALPVIVTAVAEQTTSQDLAAVALDGVIRGEVVDENRQPLANAYVWINGPDFAEQLLTGADGQFMVYVPLEVGPIRASYTVGTSIPCAAGSDCIIDAPPQQVTPRPRGALAGGAALQQDTITSLGAKRDGTKVDVTGRVTQGNSGVNGVSVTFTPKAGQGACSSPVSTSTRNGAKGSFLVDNCNISASRTSFEYTVSASKGGASVGPIVGTLNINLLATASVTQAIELGLPDLALEGVALPPARSAVFDAAAGGALTLDDGTTIQIPPGAMPDGLVSSQVRIVAEPRIIGQIGDTYDPAAVYGYVFSLYEASSGRQIKQALKAPALITMRYSEEALAHTRARRGPATARVGTSAEARLRPVSEGAAVWTAADTYVLDTAANSLTVETSALGAWSLVLPSISAPIVIYFPVLRR